VNHWYEPQRAGLRRVVLRPTLLLVAGGALIVPVAWLAGAELIARIYDIDGAAAAPAMTLLLAGAWVYAGLAGWYRFLMLLDSDKWRSLTWSILQAAWILAAGFVAAASGPTAMAAVVALSQVIISAAATIWLFRATS
jgi:hypothetical protein